MSGSKENVIATGASVAVKCPHCHEPIEILEKDSLAEVLCSVCGSSFNLLTDSATVYCDPINESLGHFYASRNVGDRWLRNGLEGERRNAGSHCRRESSAVQPTPG